MMPRSTDNDTAPSRGGDGGGDGGPSEADGRSVAAATTPPPPPVGASSSSSTGAPSAGVENHPSPDSAPVPVAQAAAALEMDENCNKNEGVEEIDSSDYDAPVPVGMMDTSYARDKKAPDDGPVKSVELDGRDDAGPAPPAQLAAEDGPAATATKKTAATMPLPRTRATAPGEVWRGRPAPSAPRMPAVRPPPPSMLPTAAAARERVDPSAPAFHEVHATLVEDEPEQPVYDAVAVGEEHWARRHQKKIAGGFALVFVAMAVALGVSLGTGGGGGNIDESSRTGIEEGDDGAATVLVAATTPPTRSLSPSAQPSMHPRLCFADSEELKAAVDDYTAGGDACVAGDSECEVIQTYGWPIGTWCTSNVTDMSWLFANRWDFDYKRDFNDDLTSWDTSKVTSMGGMFSGAWAFNGDVSNFDTSKVTSMDYMFSGASSFNGDVSSFDTSKVTSMAWMFNYASPFNGDVSRWDVASVTDMAYMFNGATSFNQNLCAWSAHYSADKSFYNMFVDTSCPNQNDPAGPDTNWCAATCDSAEQGPSPMVPTALLPICELSDSEQQQCDGFDLGACQRSVCINNTCVFDTTQVNDGCACGYCVEDCTGLKDCSANCQFDPASPSALTSLLLAAPCDYDYLTIESNECGIFDVTRGRDGHFNVSRPENCFSTGAGIRSYVNVLRYGKLPFDSSFTAFDSGDFRIHTSCAFYFGLNQTFGPQKDLVLVGYTQSQGGGAFLDANPYPNCV